MKISEKSSLTVFGDLKQRLIFGPPCTPIIMFSCCTTLVSAIGRSELLDHGCGTAYRPTCDSPTLLFISSAGR